ncbi:glycosyltransferase [Ramlibacter sp.]|uniref:glycosyltransferase n=1 Tax=Ramlibacter sp. TaxID=1917967 RepID=UPI0017A710CE|nr:glycosyltransferase [Ramlibacter sp.]MBA2673304.1 glycosyltransferase [Ramlibacter sp.]
MTHALAPIALFAYKRPDHLARALASLRANPEAAASRLIVFCDGPKGAADAAGVAAVRELTARIDGFAAVEVHRREANAGLASSVIAGVTRVLGEHGRVIVVEDDLVVAPGFLRYMNDALALYADDDAVASVHAYLYPLARMPPPTFFLRGADCWGWATWARAWRHFDADGARLLAQLRAANLTRAFDLDGAYPYTCMLEDQIAGRNDSWAIRWHASAFLRSMLTLYPGHNLVHNIGNDASGTHSGDTRVFEARFAGAPVCVERIALREDTDARREVARFLASTRAPHRAGWRARLRLLLRRR